MVRHDYNDAALVTLHEVLHVAHKLRLHGANRIPAVVRFVHVQEGHNVVLAHVCIFTLKRFGVAGGKLTSALN